MWEKINENTLQISQSHHCAWLPKITSSLLISPACTHKHAILISVWWHATCVSLLCMAGVYEWIKRLEWKSQCVECSKQNKEVRRGCVCTKSLSKQNWLLYASCVRVFLSLREAGTPHTKCRLLIWYTELIHTTRSVYLLISSVTNRIASQSHRYCRDVWMLLRAQKVKN